MPSIGGDLAAGPFTSTGGGDTWGGGSDGWGNESFDWGSNITSWLKLAPNIISSVKGNPYASGQYGQGSLPTAGAVQGGGVYAGGSLLGASGFGQISGTTMLLIAVAAIFLLKGRR